MLRGPCHGHKRAHSDARPRVHHCAPERLAQLSLPNKAAHACTQNDQKQEVPVSWQSVAFIAMRCLAHDGIAT